MKRRLVLPLLLAVALGGAAPSAEQPRLVTGTGGALVLTELPPLLDDPTVAAQLTTGLTATLVVRAWALDPRGRRRARQPSGGGRVEIRYDLWDEVFHVRTQGIDGRWTGAAAQSQAALGAWWQALTLPVLGPRGTLPAGTRQVRLEIDLVPFSQAEEADTRRWFAESLEGGGRSGAEAVGQTADDRAEPLREVFNLLLTTSIQQRVLASWHWDVPLEREVP